MVKKTVLILLMITTMMMGAATGCGPKTDIAAEAVNSLISIVEAGVDGSDAELAAVAEQINENQLRSLKLKQIVEPAEEWIELQKQEMAKLQKGSTYSIQVTDEGLQQLKNDYYGISELEITGIHIGTTGQEFSTKFQIVNLASGTSYSRETIDNDLSQRKAKLERDWQEIVDMADLSLSTLGDVLGHTEEWEITGINQNTYNISGMGLGWSDQLISGKWTYHSETGEITPADNPGRALNKVLSLEQ